MPARYAVTWYQHEIQLPSFPRGLHPITHLVLDAVPEIAQLGVGLLHVFLRHTSASLSINENADPDVLEDLDRVLDTLAPEDFPYQHTVEGHDDMPGHVKSSLLGCWLSIPIRDGRLCLGTWQGICLCEHRQHAGHRHLVLTVQGEGREEGREERGEGRGKET
jgi:secondary thiamine-phosphate synthase enzyme